MLNARHATSSSSHMFWMRGTSDEPLECGSKQYTWGRKDAQQEKQRKIFGGVMLRTQ